LLSTAIATLLAVTIPDLQEDFQATSAFYLQELALRNLSPTQSPPFSVSTEALITNLLLFLSLLISLSASIMATVVQQWARQYVRYTQPSQRGPKTRARIRAMFSHSVDKMFIKCMGSLLPCYLNLAILFFLLSLLAFLFNRNKVIFVIMTLLFVWCLAIYGFFTFLPVFQHDSLLYTPISTLPVSLLAALICVLHVMFRHRFNYKGWGIIDWAFEDVGKKADAIASRRSPEIDIHVLDWSLHSLSDDDAVETYLRTIPDFFRKCSAPLGDLSPEAKNRLQLTKNRLQQTLRGFLDRTFSSNAVTEDVRNSRLIVGLDASHAALGPKETLRILENILKRTWPHLLHSVEMGHSLISWGNNSDACYELHIRSIVSCIIANTPKPDERCIALAMDQLDISDDRLRGYLSLPDTVSLVSFIDIAHRIRSQVSDGDLRPLHSRSNSPMELPYLQYDFCALWNEVVQKANDDSNDRILIHILKNFRRAYMALHTDTGAFPLAFSPSTADDDIVLNHPSSYPSCNIPDHNRYPIPLAQPYDPARDNSESLFFARPGLPTPGPSSSQ